MNKKCYIFQKHFFRELFTSVLPDKVFTFTHVISVNNECRESSNLSFEMQSVSKRVLHCKSRLGIQYSHIQHTLVSKVDVGQPDKTSAGFVNF